MVWDSQVQDGYKRIKSLAGSEDTQEKGPRPVPMAWDGKKSSHVVEELLRNAADKAYGTEGEAGIFWLLIVTVHSVFAGV